MIEHDETVEPPRPSESWRDRVEAWRRLAGRSWRSLWFRDLGRPAKLPDPGRLGGGPWRIWVGREGERLGARFLRREGMKVLHRNFRAKGGGEVDLVCRDGEVLVFVEIKTRTSQAFGRPAEAVSKEKQRLVIRGAVEWLRLLDFPEIAFRFDVVEVTLARGQPPVFGLIQGAFRMPDDYRY